MSEEMNNEMQGEEGFVDNVETLNIEKLADGVKAIDDALNKLKVQNLDFILDIPLKVTVDLGRTEVVIKDLLQLGQGSVLELDKLARVNLWKSLLTENLSRKASCCC